MCRMNIGIKMKIDKFKFSDLGGGSEMRIAESTGS